MRKLLIAGLIGLAMASLSLSFDIQYPPGKGGGGGNVPSGTSIGDVPVWDGSAYVPGAVSGSTFTGLSTANADARYATIQTMTTVNGLVSSTTIVTKNYYSGMTLNGTVEALAFKGLGTLITGTVNAALNADTLDGIDSSAFLALGSDTWVSSRNTGYVTKNYYSGVTLSGTVEATAFKGIGTLITGTVNASLNSDTLDGLDGSAYMLYVGSDTWVSSKDATYVTKNYYLNVTFNSTIGTAPGALSLNALSTVNATNDYIPKFASATGRVEWAVDATGGGGGGGSYSYKKTFLPTETKFPVIDTTVSGAALSVSSANLSVDVALFSPTVTQGRLLMVDIPQNMTIVSFNILGRSDIQNTGVVNYWIYSRSVSLNASPGGAWTSVNLVIAPAQTIQAADKWYKVVSGNIAIGNLGWTAGETFQVLFARGAGSNDDTMTVTSSVSAITVEMQ